MNRQIRFLAFILACTLSHAQTPAVNRPAFDVATIKPSDPAKNPGAGSGWSTSGSSLKIFGTLHTFIKQAYGIEDTQISGGPNWLDRDMFEINAKASSPDFPRVLWLMLQSLLAERFKLAVHTETRQLPVYSLTVAKGGSKLRRPDAGVGSTSMGPTLIRGTMDTDRLARSLTSILGRTVIDNTGLKDAWHFSLTWAPEGDTTKPSLFTAIQEQLGLKLESTKGPVQVYVVDHADKPSEN